MWRDIGVEKRRKAEICIYFVLSQRHQVVSKRKVRSDTILNV